MTLGEAIDLIIEQEDVDVKIAAQEVDGMVATNAKAVAISGNNPDAELGAGGLEAGCYGCGTTVDRVHAIGIHIIWEA